MAADSGKPYNAQVSSAVRPAPSIRLWDGVIHADGLNEYVLGFHQQLHEAASSREWATFLALLTDNPLLVNSCRPDDESCYAPLHRAARNGAPAPIIDGLVALGAWRAIRDARGDRAVDLAIHHGHADLEKILTPPVVQQVSTQVVQDLEGHFHALIRSRVSDLVAKYRLRLPQLECLIEMVDPSVTFQVPGMYGGFRYELRDVTESSASLQVWSWCRIVDGSGEHHEVTTEGYRLIEDGLY